MFKRVKTLTSIYCRWANRRVTDCPYKGGPARCPLRADCPAYTDAARQPSA